MHLNIIDWERQPWVAAEWEGIDQAPAFLAAMRPGDEILALSGAHVTTPYISGVGPTATSPFTTRLVAALCGLGTAEIDLDLVSREGMRTDELGAIIERLYSQGRARRTPDDHWVFSPKAGPQLQRVVEYLIGSNLDYVITLNDLRLTDRDATMLLLAGDAAAIDRAWSGALEAASETDTELKPLGWDF